MRKDRNCQSCKYYKDGYCKNLELKPCYPSKGCGDFSKCNELKKDTMEVLDKLRAEIEKLEHLNIEDGSDGYDKYIEQYEVLQIIDKYKAESEVDNGKESKQSDQNLNEKG